MDSSSMEWSYKGTVVRNRPVARMVSATDIWKAVGSPTPFRPDKWLKSDLIQEKLEGFALITEKEMRDEKGKIVGVSGVLEIVRGGRYSQGTFISYDLAMDYTRMLSNELHWWFTGVLPSGSQTVKESIEEATGSTEPDYVLALPFGSDDVPSSVRITPDGRISVYDGIGYTTGQKNPYQVWSDLLERIPLFLHKTEKYKFILTRAVLCLVFRSCPFFGQPTGEVLAFP
jgi:KilA-N domain